MPRPITAIIHQQALAHNLSVARQCMPNSQVFAVVKANAYGHGIERVYAGLEGADGFAFLDIEEGARLRALGCKKPLMLLEGIFAFEDLFACVKHEMSFAIHSRHQVQWLKQFAEIAITHMTHFSDADGQRFGVDGIQYQNLIFSQSIQGLEGKISLSNSAAILRHHQTLHSDIVRSGIMLYGSSPDYPTHTIQDWNLQPSMSLRSEIIAIQMIQTGESIGYGSKFIATQNMRIGIVACGYADGYQRLSATGTPVLVDSIKTQTLGRISMDMLAVDLGSVPDAQIGSEVVLWGQSIHGIVLPIDEVAAGSGTVGYDFI